MKKNLPNVFANPITKEIKNNKEISTSSINEVITLKKQNVSQKITEIFSSPNHVYKSTVKIISDGEEIVATLVGRTSNNLLTLNGDKIAINSIQYIERL